MSLDGAGSITDWNPYIYDIAFAIQKDFTYGYKNQLYSKRNLPPHFLEHEKEETLSVYLEAVKWALLEE